MKHTCLLMYNTACVLLFDPMLFRFSSVKLCSWSFLYRACA